MNRIDKKLKKLGFEKDSEDKYGVIFCRKDEKHSYIQVLEIYHKRSGNHLIVSYQKDVNSEGFNNTVGLTYEEVKLAMEKYKQISRKYKWEKGGECNESK